MELIHIRFIAESGYLKMSWVANPSATTGYYRYNHHAGANAAHQANPACARCHVRIDPLRFVMENFDRVRLWREFYPIYTEESSESLKEEFYANRGEGLAWIARTRLR